MKMKINKVIKTLILSDISLNLGWGLWGPIFALFIEQNIQGGGPKVAGFAAMIFWLTKSTLQIPIGRYLDRKKGEKDDFLFLFFGTLFAGFVPFGYLVSKKPWHIYFWQLIFAGSMAFVIPSWLAIFTRHIDKGKEGFEWSLRSTSMGYSVGIAGALGGLIASFFGFKIVCILVGSFTFLASFLLLATAREISPRDGAFPWGIKFLG